MCQKIIDNLLFEKIKIVIILMIFQILGNISLYGQQSGFIWIKTFKPGSANLNDLTIDKSALIFVDSLMRRDDIEVQFLGGADNLLWKQSEKVNEISSAWDQAKKLERASKLRERYGWGEIGTTDEPIRGVKVIWMPKRPDIFNMNDRIKRLEDLTDSLTLALLTLNSKQNREFAALGDSLVKREPNFKMTSIAEISTSYFDWEIKSGFIFWTAGKPYDLFTPYVGIALKRQKWAIEFQGGLTPWSKNYPDGKRSDAFLMGTINLFSESWYGFKTGIFSGWEFFTSSDQWTMKVMGVTAGPTIRWKIINTFVGYNLGKLYTLVESTRWVQGVIITTSFNFKLTSIL